MKRSNNVLKYRYHVLRGKLVQPLVWALVFLGPLFDVFRVDMINMHMVFLGENYPFETRYLMWLPIGFYGAVIVVSIVSFIWGRLFCGWTCPHNTLTEWTRPFRALFAIGTREEKPRWMKLMLRDHPHREELLKVASPFVGLMMTYVFSVLLTFYIVPPDWVLGQYASGHPHIALVFGNVLFTMIGLFLLYAGHDFCRTCCPYGMGQSISAYHENSFFKPMEIAFSGDKTAQCQSCTVCQQVCPVDIDPRDPANLKVGQFYGCFNCGECVDACKYLHDFKDAPGLLSFAPPGLTKKEQKKSQAANS